MRLDRIELIPYSLRFREPYVSSRGELRERNLLMVRLTDESGAVGLGETVSLSLRRGPSIETISAEITERCWPVLEGNEIPSERIWAALAACRGRGAGLQAVSAIDLALHDLAGKLADVPVWKLLGAESYEPVLCNATLPSTNPTALGVLAATWMEKGFRTLKLKVGLAGDIQQVKRVREVVGPGARIRIDANGAWSAEEAISRLRMMRLDRLEIVEQPTVDLESMARVRAETGLRIAADESLVDSRDARNAADSGACDLGTVKLAKCGGIIAALEIARELAVYMSSALDGPLGIAAAAHTVQRLQQDGHARMAHGLATASLFADEIALSGPRMEADRLHLPDAPGLGVTIDPAALEQVATRY